MVECPIATESGWYVYVLECADGSLYTGIARDVERRATQHNEGRGAKYTRGRGPVKVLACSPALARGPALELEATVKKKRGVKAKLGALSSTHG
jgi:putative endonuclease